MSGHGAETEADILVIEPFGWGYDVKVRVPPEHTAEVRGLLDDAKLPYSRGGEFSHGPVLDLLVLTVQQREAWGALAGIIGTYLGRNATRSVRIGDRVVRGYAVDDAERLIRELESQVEGNGKPPAGPEGP